MYPVKGQVVYSELTNDLFVMGFAGRVTTVSQQGNVVTYKCEPVAPSDVYDRLVTVGKIEASGNDDSSTPRRIADDGVVTSPKITIDVGYEDYIHVKGSASMTIETSQLPTILNCRCQLHLRPVLGVMIMKCCCRFLRRM